MKKFVALLLALIMVFALCACGNTATTPEDKSPRSGRIRSSRRKRRFRRRFLPHHYR